MHQRAWHGWGFPSAGQGAHMQVAAFMDSEATWCTPHATLAEVAELLARSGTTQAVVVSDAETRRPVGLIAQPDLAQAAAVARRPLEEIVARDAMATGIVAVDQQLSAGDCAALMDDLRADAFAVCDRSGRLCGVVERRVLLRHVHVPAPATVVPDDLIRC